MLQLPLNLTGAVDSMGVSASPSVMVWHRKRYENQRLGSGLAHCRRTKVAMYRRRVGAQRALTGALGVGLPKACTQAAIDVPARMTKVPLLPAQWTPCFFLVWPQI